jgi:hypothetical protein
MTQQDFAQWARGAKPDGTAMAATVKAAVFGAGNWPVHSPSSFTVSVQPTQSEWQLATIT